MSSNAEYMREYRRLNPESRARERIQSNRRDKAMRVLRRRHEEEYQQIYAQLLADEERRKR